MKFLLATTKATSSLLALQAAFRTPQQAQAVSVLSSRLASTKESIAAEQRSRYSLGTEIEAVTGDARGCWVKELNADHTKSFVSCPNTDAPRGAGVGTNWSAGTLNNKGEPDVMNYIVRIKGTGITGLGIKGTFVTQSSVDSATSGSNTDGNDNSFFLRWDDADGTENSDFWNCMDDGTLVQGLDTFAAPTYNKPNSPGSTETTATPMTLTGSERLTEGLHKLSIFVREDGLRMGRLKLECRAGETDQFVACTTDDAEFVAAVCTGSPSTGNFNCIEQ